MAESYGTAGSVPSEFITVDSGGTIAVSAAFERTVALVGGYDAANGNATAGEATKIESSSGARTAFGENSELAKQVDLAFTNGASLVYGVPPAETQTTESVAASSSYVLSNAPAFDPRVNEEHTIDITDTVEAVSVDVVYVDDTPTQPSTANTAEVNPATGEVEFDSSSDYDIQYTYGDYVTAIEAAVAKVPRVVGVCTENTSVGNDLLGELNTYDVDFQFSHGLVGETGVEASTYSQGYDDRRLAEVVSGRGYTDEAETEEVRTVGAVAGKQAGNALGDTITSETLNGIVSLKNSFGNTAASTILDAGGLPLQQGDGIKVVKDRTTSPDAQFSRLAWSEIVDEATEISHQISDGFVSDSNTDTNRLALAESHRSSYDEMVDENLLDAYHVAFGSTADDNAVKLNIGLDVVDYMDRIEVDITVGDVVLNGGAS